MSFMHPKPWTAFKFAESGECWAIRDARGDCFIEFLDEYTALEIADEVEAEGGAE